MKGWFSFFENVSSGGKKTISSLFFATMVCYGSGLLHETMKKVAVGFITCIFALGGATIGVLLGAIKGQTTETGLLRGAGVGAVTGAITAIQLLELMLNGEPFSKVALIGSLLNGKVFMEWVSPAVLKAYQWQISSVETSFRENSDIFETAATKGMPLNHIKMLPKFEVHSMETMRSSHNLLCSICLQDFHNREVVRTLPSCGHSFHLHCVDEWLSRHASCPLCRKVV